LPTDELFLIDDPALQSAVRSMLRRLPPVSGAPVAVRATRGLRDRRGDVHAGAFLRTRCLIFDCTPAEFPRIFVHELFHFVWLRVGNARRRSFEDLLRNESRRGELGWSAEWRRRELRASDIRARNRRWREYCCESFCDTAAWIYSGVRKHEEFTLAARFRRIRRKWFHATIGTRELSI